MASQMGDQTQAFLALPGRSGFGWISPNTETIHKRASGRSSGSSSDLLEARFWPASAGVLLGPYLQSQRDSGTSRLGDRARGSNREVREGLAAKSALNARSLLWRYATLVLDRDGGGFDIPAIYYQFQGFIGGVFPEVACGDCLGFAGQEGQIVVPP